MIRATLVRFDPDSGRSASDLMDRNAGELTTGELVALLGKFRTIDPIENVEAEPEIVLETGRQKFVVTTLLGRLHLVEPRKAFATALVLSPEDVVAEIDGSAAAARNRTLADARARHHDFKVVGTTVAPPLSTVGKPGRALPRRIALGAAASVLAAYVLLSQSALRRQPPRVDFEPISDARQNAAYRKDLAGVYMTGSQPGDYGISVGEDGTMKLFQLNAQTTPSLMRDTGRLGRIEGQLALLGSLPGGPLRFTGKSSLTFSGRTFHRIQ
ncbi:hypothetical protein [Horticoccus sp. 23ND18S-11]|uniref:hypothetical protein n=1 Tax=Horticoccus sp. 23ND18S-11 TaxID=3391832 RepID=UPI0039C998E5